MNKENIFIIIAVLAFVLIFGGVLAQTPPQIILTWQANNFYPSDYPGKAVASPDSSVTVAAEVLLNSKLLDLSQADFTWLADDKIAGRGKNLKEVSFQTKKTAGDSVFVRVIIEIGEETLENSIRIPTERPVVVIDAPLPDRGIASGGAVTLRAMPYFFSVSSLEDLEFLWRVNDMERGGEGRNLITLNVGSPQTEGQRTIRITSSVQNKKNLFEFSNGKIELNVF